MERRNPLGVRLHPRSTGASSEVTDNAAMVDDLVVWLAETFILEELDIQTEGSRSIVLEARIRIPDVTGDPSPG